MDLFYYLYTGIGLMGMGVIVWGVVLIFSRVLRLEFTRLRGRAICREREALRHQLGSYLLLGIEFLIAADIIRTITDPTLEEMAILGGIVLIRTVLSYFLDRELAASYPCVERTKEEARVSTVEPQQP